MSPKVTKIKGENPRCAYCGAEAPIVWVHGHGQCAACGINVDECCRGERGEARSNKTA